MKTLAIYAGSFSPFHIGHLNIVEKAEEIFRENNVLIAIGVNPAKIENKQIDIDLVNERAYQLSQRTGRKVEVYLTFLHEFIERKERDGFNVVLVRGLRNGDDLSHENNQLSFIEDFKPNVKSIFIMCDKKFEHISSSSIKVLESFRKGSSETYLV
jgi:pantetheine-phosphate adenylyltransferase